MKPPQKETDPLGQWAGQALRQIPQRSAPPGLATQILAELRCRANLPWYQRPWIQWPRPHKWFSALALAVVLVGTFGIGLPLLEDSASRSLVGQGVSQAFDYLGSLQAISISVGRSLRLTLSHISTTTFTLATASLVAVWLSTLGLGALCWRATTQSR